MSKRVYLKYQYLRLGILFLILTGGLLSRAQQPAFPGAEGAGKFTTGGRGTPAIPTTVFEVTNLNDDNNPGSLRYALSQTAAYRTIVFRISGTIHLNSKLDIKSNTTIAGQTAPGDGICIADHPVAIIGNNVIVRYMRFRMGDKNQNLGMVNGSGSDDAFGNLDGKNIIIDHCTASWSSDEALTIYRGDSITVQWCFVTEPLNYSYHFETGDTDFEEHGYGGIWGGRHASFHHNLIAHVKGRAPRFDGSRNLSPFTQGQENADFRNNVIYNWISYNVNGGEGGNYNVVNNYYKYGPSTSNGSSAGIAIKSEIMNPYKSSSLPYPKVYLNGNYVDGYPVATNSNWKGVAMNGGTLADTVQSKVDVPFNLLPVVQQNTTEAYNLVLNFSGTSLPRRDTLDERIADDVRNRTGRVIDVQGGYPHGTPYIQTISAWPTLQSTAAPPDTDHDGMPDQWETNHGLNPNDPTDRNIVTVNGYTNLENYLNSLANNAIEISGTFNNFLQNIGTPSTAQTYVLRGNNLTGDVTITPPLGYQLSSDGGISWSQVSAPIMVQHVNGNIASTNILVRLNAPGIGTFNGPLTHAVNGTEVSVSLSGITSVATAVNDINFSDSVLVYPNPFNGRLLVSYPRTYTSSFLEIITADGKKVLVKDISPGSTQAEIETGIFPSGVYIIRYMIRNRVVTKKIIKIL